MRFYFRLLLVSVLLAFISISAGERRQEASSKPRSEGGSGLCVGVLPTASPGSWATTASLFGFGQEISQLPWESLLHSPGLISVNSSVPRGSTQLILGLPEKPRRRRQISVGARSNRCGVCSQQLLLTRRGSNHSRRYSAVDLGGRSA